MHSSLNEPLESGSHFTHTHTINTQWETEWGLMAEKLTSLT